MANGGEEGGGGIGKMFVWLHNLTNLLTNDCTLLLEEMSAQAECSSPV